MLIVLAISLVICVCSISCDNRNIDVIKSTSAVIEYTSSSSSSFIDENVSLPVNGIEDNEVLIGNTSGNIVNGGKVIINNSFDGKNYYLDENNNYYIIDKDKKVFFFNYDYYFLNMKDEWLYYVYDHMLYKMKKDGSSSNILLNICCEIINITDSWIYIFGDNCIFRIDFQGNNKQIVLKNIICYEFFIYDGDIYYTDENFMLHKYDNETKENLIIVDYMCININFFNESIFFYTYDGIYQLYVSTNVITKILDRKAITSLNAYCGYLYYSTEDEDDFNIYKMDLTTHEEQIIYKDIRARNINIIGDYILFDDILAEDYNISIMKIDGSAYKTME